MSITKQAFEIYAPRNETDSGFGAQSLQSDRVLKARGNVRFLRGRELYAAQQVQAQVEAIFEVRNMRGLNTGLILKWNGDEWDITAVLPQSRGGWVELSAKRRGLPS